jgi:hypothetical protein
MAGKDKGRAALTLEMLGQKSTVVIVLNGCEGWIKKDDTTTELDKETLAEHRRHSYAQEPALLLPFARKDREYKLAPLGEMKIMGQAAVGVRVTCDGREEVRLFFSKETSLPLRCEWDAGKEVHELLLSDYREVGGLKRPMKVIGKSGGRPAMEYVIRDYAVVERLDESLFARPCR